MLDVIIYQIYYYCYDNNTNDNNNNSIMIMIMCGDRCAKRRRCGPVGGGGWDGCRFWTLRRPGGGTRTLYLCLRALQNGRGLGWVQVLDPEAAIMIIVVIIIIIIIITIVLIV